MPNKLYTISDSGTDTSLRYGLDNATPTVKNISTDLKTRASYSNWAARLKVDSGKIYIVSTQGVFGYYTESNMASFTRLFDPTFSDASQSTNIIDRTSADFAVKGNTIVYFLHNSGDFVEGRVHFSTNSGSTWAELFQEGYIWSNTDVFNGTRLHPRSMYITDDNMLYVYGPTLYHNLSAPTTKQTSPRGILYKYNLAGTSPTLVYRKTISTLNSEAAAFQLYIVENQGTNGADVLYAQTHVDPSMPGSIIKSVDGGATFSNLPARTLNSVKPDPASPSVVTATRQRIVGVDSTILQVVTDVYTGTASNSVNGTVLEVYNSAQPSGSEWSTKRIHAYYSSAGSPQYPAFYYPTATKSLDGIELYMVVNSKNTLTHRGLRKYLPFTLASGTNEATVSSVFNSSTALYAMDTAIIPDNTSPSDILLSASSISESAAVGTTIGTLSATDAEGGAMTFSLVAGAGSADNGGFTIDGNALKTAVALDYETKSSYSIRVRATDSGSLTYEKAFTISVTNVNEAPSNITLSAASIQEGNVVNAVIGTLSAIDPDTGDTSFTFSISGGADAAKFNINGAELRASQAFDYEAPADANTDNVYVVEITAQDAGGLSYVKSFNISVSNNASDDPIEVFSNVSVNGRVKITAAVDPRSTPVLLGGAPLPTGSVVRNSVDSKKFIKKAGTDVEYSAILSTVPAAWKWASEGETFWAMLQDI